MNSTTVALAKLAGIRKALQAVLDKTEHKGSRPVTAFDPKDVANYFHGAVSQLAVLREDLPQLFGDFPAIEVEPEQAWADPTMPKHYKRWQLETLTHTIEQIFEVRANSELAAPEAMPTPPRVFISHGRATDWREVQAYIEKDAGIATLELAQQPNFGRTVLSKLDDESRRCTSAVIVMTGDDVDADGNLRARENVMHEIGYLQGRLGHAAVCLLHEEGTNIPSNIHGLVYVPFPKGQVSAAFGVLRRELDAFYRRS